jgi:hypothetical protein
MKPIITIYSVGGDSDSKKFEGFIEAAFWMGVDHSEKNLASVKVRQPTQSYDEEVSTLREFTQLLIKQQLNFSVEFFAEPLPAAETEPEREAAPEISQGEDQQLVTSNRNQFQSEIERLKGEYKRGAMSKKQYKSKKEDLLKLWKESVEGRLGL